MDTIVQSVIADRGDAGCRLDLVLLRRLTGLRGATRTRLQRWIEDGHVELNGQPARRPAMRTSLGDCIRVAVPSDAVRRPRGLISDDAPIDESDLKVLFEDEHLLAVNKPAGLVVHPAYKHPDGTLMDQLRARARSWPSEAQPSILGRLDKLTSGVVLVAKQRSVHTALQHTLATRHSGKFYLAIVSGPVKAAQGTIELPLARDAGDRRRVVVSPTGRPSVTRFERLGQMPHRDGSVALLRCRLITGRMHQLRVHLAARGWPIVGDPVYGRPSAPVADAALAGMLHAFTRQALHAQRVAFVHPVTEAMVTIDAPVPVDMQQVIDHCGWFQRFRGNE